jgi:hypothetical protein
MLADQTRTHAIRRIAMHVPDQPTMGASDALGRACPSIIFSAEPSPTAPTAATRQGAGRQIFNQNQDVAVFGGSASDLAALDDAHTEGRDP